MSSTKPQRKSPFRFHTNREYFDELITDVKGAVRGDRVLLMTMYFEPTDPTIAVLCRELVAAASRGVHVTLAVDAHSFLVNSTHLPGPLWARESLPKHLSIPFKNKLQILESINSYPTSHAAIINHPRRRFDLPIGNRSHIKAAIINDKIYLGGCNLQASDWVDIMIHWNDEEISNRLYSTFQDMIRRKHAGQALSWVDRGIRVDNDTDIFIDSGLRGQSLIFEEALKLIDDAEEWLLITGQYFPNSITAKHLLAATKRGVKVEVVYSHPRHHGLIGGLGQQISIMRERSRLPRILFEHGLARAGPMLHAKLIASDKGVMVGSHNYIRAGVVLGTAEIAFKSKNPKLAKDAVTALRRGLKKSKK